MRFQPVDRAPLQYYYTPVGYYEHGEKLNALYASLPGDFEPYIKKPIPSPPPSDFDEGGFYHAFERDAWGTVWDKRIYGVAGIPCEYPLKRAEDVPGFAFPERPAFDLIVARERIQAWQREHYYLANAGSLFERLISLRPQEDVLCDIALGDPLINELADRIIAYHAEDMRRAIESGADGVSFGDDYGTERGMLMSPNMWRAFFKPRLRRLFQTAVDAGLDIVFHSCGMILPILKDLKEIGVTAIWPQLPAYDMHHLAATCRELKLAVAIHTDRANAITFGTPDQVRALVSREYGIFDMANGGSWFYVEADNGFPFENIDALVTTIARWR
jgi:hypothetical protein